MAMYIKLEILAESVATSCPYKINLSHLYLYFLLVQIHINYKKIRKQLAILCHSLTRRQSRLDSPASSKVWVLPSLLDLMTTFTYLFSKYKLHASCMSGNKR